MGPKSGHNIRHRGIIRATQSRRWINAISALILAGTTTAPAYAGRNVFGASAPSGNRDAVRAQAFADNQAQALRIQAAARERLARSAEAFQGMQAAQAAARASAAALNNVANGLVPGGLEVLPKADPDFRWDGAEDPVAAGNDVTIKQNNPQAVLHWKTFNVGRDTTVNFDQSKGGADARKWIAFNKVFDPLDAPSQIRGRINAQGQVYVINPNGIIFGGSAQVNTRTFVASTLPINENLVRDGLLNNKDAQFIFSGIRVPGGSDGTPAFEPPALPAGKKYGDIVVERGAQLRATAGQDGNGGRVMLVGANVRNDGTIDTPAGQSILAAGLQVGVRAHPENDPSLRGLDVWVGQVGDYAGRVENNGLVRSSTGSIIMAGKEVRQRGVLASTTSVNLNGRIDLLASYGAVSYPQFDELGAKTAVPFLSQLTGLVELAPGSLTTILTEANGKILPGTRLSQNSQVNIDGKAVYFGRGSILAAPSGDVTVRAGQWSFVDGQQDLGQHFVTGGQKFLHDRGQVYLDEGSIIDVSGSVDGFVPLAQHLLTVAMRSSELADSPLQRNSALRGVPLIVDLRASGVDDGRAWVGTPLGDLTGYLAIIERDIAQLTARGGTVSLSAGDSIVMRRGATVDVSGGLLTHGAGFVQTSMLSLGGRPTPISSARADIDYDGVYTGTATVASKWRAPQTYSSGIFNPARGYNQNAYFEGAPAGTASLNAPSLALAGNLVGKSYASPDQRTAPPALGSLRLAFLGEKNAGSVTAPVFVQHSPFAPEFRLTAGRASSPVLPEFDPVSGEPVVLPAALRGIFTLSAAVFDEEDAGFGNLSVENADGDFVFGAGTSVRLRPGGELAVSARNVRVDGTITAPGGDVSLTAYNFSPYLYRELLDTGRLVIGSAANDPPPPVQAGRGDVVLGRNGRLDVAGAIVDDRAFSDTPSFGPVLTRGGSIRLEGYSVRLPAGSVLDAGGGVHADARNKIRYGKGGDIAVFSGRDRNLETSVGGTLQLAGTLQAFSASSGGTLTLQSNFIHLGGSPAPVGGLDLAPEFFQRGGFSSYRLIGLGGRDLLGQNRPGILVASTVEPRAQTLAPLSSGYAASSISLRLGPDVFGPVSPEFPGERQAVSLHLSSTGFDDGSTKRIIEALGIVEMLPGSRITTQAGAAVTLKGDVVKVDGAITAPGGTIDLAGRASFRLPTEEADAATRALPTLEIGPSARLSAAGTSVALPDPNGLRAGQLFPGGSISLSGNIVAEQGAIFDVRGSSAVLDFSPQRLGLAPTNPRNPFKVVLGLPARVDSDGGRITLSGSQMLFSDATLLGGAGGPSASGGSLVVSSSRFYGQGALPSGADVNMVVSRTGRAADFRAGEGAAGMGFFATDRFSSGGFDNLDLGFFYNSGASPAFGGNLDFRGDIAIEALGRLRLAGGGLIKADGNLSLSASSITLGQPYQPPLHPLDGYTPFTKVLVQGSSPQAIGVAPTSLDDGSAGAGSLQARARHIEIGHSVFRNMDRFIFDAAGGDIAGYGSLNVAGDLVLRASRIYPTSLADFDIFAFDTKAGASGSISVLAAGASGAPLSAGGNLRLMAANIEQAGTLRAPQGSISLGWDGTGVAPRNPVTMSEVAVARTAMLTLGGNSLTSVSADGLTVPFGLTPDGLTWIDPRGVDVTAGGLPQRSVALSAGHVATAPNSVVDVGGGGDLLAYRWVPGIGGSSDLLGAANQSWNANTAYRAGDLVSHDNATWSARVGVTPSDYAIVPEPEDGLFWVKVPEAYAVLPGWSGRVAPVNQFNERTGKTALGGDPGYVAAGLRAGEQVYLAGIPGLASGYHTLLPRRYALLPGAFLVIPEEGKLTGSGTVISTGTSSLRRDDFLSPDLVRLAEGSYLANGWSRNGLNPAAAVHAVQTRFEVLPREVVAARAQYDIYGANRFLAASARRLDLPSVQRLPEDSARLSIHGNNGLDLAGTILARSTAVTGRAAEIDLSSLAAMTITGPGAAAPAPGSVVLSAGTLNSWGYGSLLVGGQRSETGSGVAVNVRSPQVVFDAPGGVLRGADITLAGQNTVNFSSGSAMRAEGIIGGAAQNLQLGADGALLRVSTDANAAIMRSGQPSAISQKVTVGSGATLAGAGVIVDSTYAADLDGSLDLRAGTLTLGSGQISLLLGGGSLPLTGSAVTDHLVLEGGLLRRASESDVLRLLSYRSIDFYGDGTLGSADLARLELLASGLRGYGAGAPGAVIRAADVYLARPNVGMIDLEAPASAGSLSVQSSRLLLGPGQLSVRGYDNFNVTSAAGVQAGAGGSLSLGGHATFNAPAMVGGQGVSYDITAAGALALQRAGSSVVAPGLGMRLNLQGASVNLASDILLPSGVLSVTATTGNIDVSGRLAANGQARQFFDVTRYTDGGSIDLSARQGSVRLLAGSDVSVAAHADGGDAGYLNVRSPGGVFDIAGVLDGSAGTGRASGSFTLDAGSVADFDALRTDLDNAGFFQERNLRVRTGDVTVAGTTRVRDYSLSADAGDIAVTGTIDASGETGGRISLVTSRNLTVADGAVLSVAAEKFSNAGKGGQITLEAGSAINGVANSTALLDLQAGSRIDLSVDEYVAGSYTTPGASAFYGQFEGTLHLRAPRLGNDVGIATIGSTIDGGSSILAEAFRVYQPVGGVMNRALRDSINTDNADFITAGEAAITSRLLAFAPGLTDKLVLAPGVEIINQTGDLTLGLANVNGTTNIEARSDADWDLSVWRYGSRAAPGILTLRAAGDLVFNNALSDGFTPVSKGSSLAEYADRGHSLLWLAPLQSISDTLPVNTQSWSYRLVSGADFTSSRALSTARVEALADGKGSLLVGEFFPSQVPNNIEAQNNSAAAIGRFGQTADTIRIDRSDRNPPDRGTRYEVIRTGTGNIEVAAGRDVQFRNPFASISTAGVGLSVGQVSTVYAAGDFSVPLTGFRQTRPGQLLSFDLGVPQQVSPLVAYGAHYGRAGGDVRVAAGGDIARYQLPLGETVPVPDASGQTPATWLLKRGQTDANGFFAAVTTTDARRELDRSASTTWWVDYSTFFQSFGALGGGDIRLAAGGTMQNIDAAIPTTARMAGVDPATGLNLRPSAERLVETGGGDLVVRAGRNVDGGSVYVERGAARIFAAEEITTNRGQSANSGILSSEPFLDPLTWQPLTFYLGRASVDVRARGDVLAGPSANPFLMPSGINNQPWYRTAFSTYGESSMVSVSSIGGSITHRWGITQRGDLSTVPVLSALVANSGLLDRSVAGFFRPWLRLLSYAGDSEKVPLEVGAPVFRSTSFSGDINLAGTLNAAPSPIGDISLLASGSLVGLVPTGRTQTGANVPVTAWTSARLNLSDAPVLSLPGVLRPVVPDNSFFSALSAAFDERGGYKGDDGTSAVKTALHSPDLLRVAAPDPLRLYAAGGDVLGFELFSGKRVSVTAGRDATDLSLYFQHLSPSDISLVSAGRDIIPFNENNARRASASDLLTGNIVVDASGKDTGRKPMAGDVQVGGRGIVQVLAGRDLDLGIGPNRPGGTGVGLNSIGRLRNPFLPFEGAHYVVMAGVGGASTGPALGLTGSSLAFANVPATGFLGNTAEHKAVAALRGLFERLKQVGKDAAQTGNYDAGYAAVEAIFGKTPAAGSIFTRSRDLRTTSGGSILAAAPGGGITMASDISGNPLTPPGIVTEYGGEVSLLTGGNVDIGRARIFTLRGGDLTVWSSRGDIAAGTAAKTVVTAPPTRVLIDPTSAEIETDLGGLATGGGIGVLASVAGVEPGAVTLLAPRGTVDAGDAGIRATGNITIAAAQVLNADNISAGGTSVGVPAAAPVSVPNVGGLSSASSSTAATTAAASDVTRQAQSGAATDQQQAPSTITVEVLGYGGGEEREEDEAREARATAYTNEEVL